MVTHCKVEQREARTGVSAFLNTRDMDRPEPLSAKAAASWSPGSRGVRSVARCCPSLLTSAAVCVEEADDGGETAGLSKNVSTLSAEWNVPLLVAGDVPSTCLASLAVSRAAISVCVRNLLHQPQTSIVFLWNRPLGSNLCLHTAGF